MMKRTTLLMLGVLVLMFVVHAVGKNSGHTDFPGVLRMLAQILSGAAAVFIAWLGTTSKLPSWVEPTKL